MREDKMKSIVVAIEFPIEEREVLNISKKMASEFKAKLYIVHSETVDSYINHIVMEDNLQLSNKIMEEYKNNFKKQMKDLHDELVSEKIDAECVLTEGSSVDNILKIAKEKSAEMIILGSHEHGKFYHLVFGSTHELLINKSNIPVLIIPPHIKG